MNKSQKQISLQRRLGMKVVSILSPESKARQSIIQKMVDCRIEKALDVWIREKKYCETATISSTANQLGTTHEELSHYFKTVEGTSFLSWRTDLRIQEACRILEEEPPETLRQVRVMVGIPDKSNFRRYFKRFTGKTLAQWLSEKQLHIR